MPRRITPAAYAILEKLPRKVVIDRGDDLVMLLNSEAHLYCYAFCSCNLAFQFNYNLFWAANAFWLLVAEDAKLKAGADWKPFLDPVLAEYWELASEQLFFQNGTFTGYNPLQPHASVVTHWTQRYPEKIVHLQRKLDADDDLKKVMR
jgi:hypothetical protein